MTQCLCRFLGGLLFNFPLFGFVGVVPERGFLLSFSFEIFFTFIHQEIVSYFSEWHFLGEAERVHDCKCIAITVFPFAFLGAVTFIDP